MLTNRPVLTGPSLHVPSFQSCPSLPAPHSLPILPTSTSALAVVHFAPPEDQRIDVTAKLGVPRALSGGPGGANGNGGNGSSAAAAKAAAAGGSLTLRYQPSPASPYTFFDIKARTRGAASAAAVRGCLFDAHSNLAVWAELPVVSTSASGATSAALGGAQALRLGAKYCSPALSVGAVVNPAQSTLSHAFAVGSAAGGWVSCLRSGRPALNLCCRSSPALHSILPTNMPMAVPCRWASLAELCLACRQRPCCSWTRCLVGWACWIAPPGRPQRGSASRQPALRWPTSLTPGRPMAGDSPPLWSWWALFRMGDLG